MTAEPSSGARRSPGAAAVLGVVLLVVTTVAAVALAMSAPVDAGTGATTGAAEITAGEVSVGTARADPEGTVTVLVSTDASDVAGFQANVTFDPAVVRVRAVEAGDLGEPVVTVDNDAGWVLAVRATTDAHEAPTLLRITFVIVGEPGDRTPLGLVGSDTVLSDTDGERIDVALSPGSVTVNDGTTETPPPPDPPTQTPTPTTTETTTTTTETTTTATTGTTSPETTAEPDEPTTTSPSTSARTRTSSRVSPGQGRSADSGELGGLLVAGLLVVAGLAAWAARQQ